MGPDFTYDLGAGAQPLDPFETLQGPNGEPIQVPREYLDPPQDLSGLGAQAPLQPSALASVPQDAPAAPTPPDITLAPGTSRGDSFGVARSGPAFNQQQIQGFQKGTRGELQRADTKGATWLQDQQDQLDSLAANQQQTALERGDVEQKIAAAQAPYAQAWAKYSDDFARYERETLATTQAEAKQARQRYETSVAELGAMQIQPQKLWSDKVGGGMAALAAGIGGFLTARGVDNDIMGQLNRNIDRDVNAQMANMANKKDVTQGFAQAYRMLVDENDSAAQARMKMRGFYLDQYQAQLQAKAAEYGSALAQIGTDETVNKIQQERFKLGNEVEKQAADRIAEDKKTAIEMARIGVQYAGISSAERMQKSAQEAAAALAANKALATLDPNIGALKASSGKVIGKIAPTWADDKETVRSVQNTILQQEDLMTKGAKLVNLMRRVGGQFKGAGNSEVKAWLASDNPDAEELQSLYTAFTNTLVYDRSGKAINKEEMQRINEEFPVESLFTKEGAPKVMSTRLRDMNRKIQGNINAFIVPFNEAELGVIAEGGQNYSPFKDHAAQQDAQLRDLERTDDELDKLKQTAFAPDADALQHSGSHVLNWGGGMDLEDPERRAKYNQDLVRQFGADPSGPTKGTEAVDQLTAKFFWPGASPEDRARIVDTLQELSGGAYEVPTSSQRRAAESLDELYTIAERNPGLIPGLTRPRK